MIGKRLAEFAEEDEAAEHGVRVCDGARVHVEEEEKMPGLGGRFWRGGVAMQQELVTM